MLGPPNRMDSLSHRSSTSHRHEASAFSPDSYGTLSQRGVLGVEARVQNGRVAALGAGLIAAKEHEAGARAGTLAAEADLRGVVSRCVEAEVELAAAEKARATAAAAATAAKAALRKAMLHEQDTADHLVAAEHHIASRQAALVALRSEMCATEEAVRAKAVGLEAAKLGTEEALRLHTTHLEAAATATARVQAAEGTEPEMIPLHALSPPHYR